MNLSKNNKLTMGAAITILVILALIISRRDVERIKSLEQQSSRPQNTKTSLVSESKSYQSPILREKIVVGEKFMVKEGQISNSDLIFSPQEEKEIAVTSVKRVYMQDIGNGHTLFQGCFFVVGGYSCNFFVLNHADTLVQLTQSVQYDMRDGKSYDYEVKQKIAENVLNGTSKDFFVRVDEAPYMYQIVECGDGTTSSSCKVVGMNPDSVDGKTGIAKKELTSYMYGSTAALETNQSNIAEYRISRTIFATTSELTLKEEREDGKTKRVSISLEKNRGEPFQLFESIENVNTPVKVDYDYVNLVDVSIITIGEKKFTFTFSTSKFEKVTQ